MRQAQERRSPSGPTAQLFASLAALGLALGGCHALLGLGDLELTDDPIGSGGGDASTTTSGGGGQGGIGGGNPCETANDCPVPPVCSQATCESDGRCAEALVDPGTPTQQQTAGDCKTDVCDETGTVTVAFDDTDVPLEPPQNPCERWRCVEGSAIREPRTGESCTSPAPGVCNAEAECVACFDDDDGVSVGCPANLPVCVAQPGGDVCGECRNYGNQDFDHCLTHPNGWFCKNAGTDVFVCGCDTNSDNCANAGNGALCTPSGACGCANSSDCSGDKFGPECLTSDRCGCTEQAQCAGSPRGPKCLMSLQRCGCEVADDCAGGDCVDGACVPT